MNTFSEDMDLLLIKAVEENSIIYDADHPKYSDSLMREKVWKKIAAGVNRPSKLCKTRWVNMRDALRRKVMHDKQLGGKRRKYKYEDEMAFVKKHFKDVVHSFRDRDDDGGDFGTETESSVAVVKEPLDSDVEYEEDAGAFEFQNVHSSRDSFNGSDYVRAQADPAPVYEAASSVDPFLASIGATLRQLTPYYLNQAKTKIFQVVQEYELAQIVDKDGRPSTSSARTARDK